MYMYISYFVVKAQIGGDSVLALLDIWNEG